jgi:hypothetical protein
MRAVLQAIGVLWVALLFQGCEISDDSRKYELVALPITEVQIPESFKLDERYQFEITFERPDSCTGFRGFEVVSEETESHTVRYIMAVGAQFQEDVCSPEPESLQTGMQFICMYSTPYLFKFYTGDNADGVPEYLEIAVPVE